MTSQKTQIAPDVTPDPEASGDDLELIVSPDVNSSNLRQVQLALESAGFNVVKMHASDHQRVYAINAQAKESHSEYPQNDAAEHANNKAPQMRDGYS